MTTEALKIVREHGRDGARLREAFFEERSGQVVEVGRLMAICLARGGKILFCGNGGSAADAQHLAAEFVNRFMMERPPLPALALTTDSSILTAIGNDYGFDQIFQKQIQALGRKGDMLVAISTSGTSPNILNALRAARQKEMITVGLSGQTGGDMAAYCDHPLLIPSKSTPLVQELHIAIGHLLCQLVDHYLFEAVMELQAYLDA